MEKRKPHYPLAVVHTLVKKGKVLSTKSANTTASTLGFNSDEMVGVVIALTIDDFYKSMTTYRDHKVWQDVYRPSTKVGKIYLKLTVIDQVVIVSFKEL